MLVLGGQLGKGDGAAADGDSASDPGPAPSEVRHHHGNYNLPVLIPPRIKEMRLTHCANSTAPI